ncbi:LOW QUALITY PROTEIN: eukaryotic translation initiation factor 3 subunit G [Pluvialis apricaria]
MPTATTSEETGVNPGRGGTGDRAPGPALGENGLGGSGAGAWSSKPSWADQVEEEGGEDDKCITSELLKDIPLPGVLGGQLSAEAELLKGGESWVRGGGLFSCCLPHIGHRPTVPPSLQAPLPSPKELINGNIKTITEYREEEDGRKVKIIRTFRIETGRPSKAVARRKNWKKFGNSEFDAPGPNVATTTVSDDVFMTFITSKEDLNCQEEEDPMNKLKGQKIVSCRICKGDHWTTRVSPTRNTLGPMQKELAEQLGLSTGEKEKLPGEPEPVQAQQSKTGKYVPPSLRDGASRRGESMQPNRRADDNSHLSRVTNLSEDTRETDPELFRPFGSISRIYLAKDKTTGQSKGFAFISFHRREDAARAIAGVSGLLAYDHLILNVEWAK